MGPPPRHVSARTRRRRRRQFRSLCQLAALVTASVVVTQMVSQGGGDAGTVLVARGVSEAVAAAPGNLDVATRPGVTPAPTTTAAGDASGLLSNTSVRHYLGERKGNITAAVYDVATGITSLWRPGITQYTASIVKVDILATLFDQFEDQGHAISPREAALAKGMIEQSDNTATDALWTEAGGGAGIAAFGRDLGMSATIPGAATRWGYTKTTAADQVTLMKAIVLQGAVLEAASRKYMLELMEHVDKNEAWGISAGVAHGSTVALKNGWLALDDDGWQVNSIGWVSGHDRNYIVAVLTNSNPTEGYGIQTIQGLSSLIWAHASD